MVSERNRLHLEIAVFVRRGPAGTCLDVHAGQRLSILGTYEPAGNGAGGTVSFQLKRVYLVVGADPGPSRIFVTYCADEETVVAEGNRTRG